MVGGDVRHEKDNGFNINLQRPCERERERERTRVSAMAYNKIINNTK